MLSYFQVLSPIVFLLSYVVLIIYRDTDSEEKAIMPGKQVLGLILIAGVMGLVARDFVIIVAIIVALSLAYSDFKYHIVHLPSLVALFLVTVALIPDAVNSPYEIVSLTVVAIAIILPIATADLIGILVLSNVLLISSKDGNLFTIMLAVIGCVGSITFLVKMVKKENGKIFPMPLLFPVCVSIALCLVTTFSATQTTLVVLGIVAIPLAYYLFEKGKKERKEEK